MHPSIATAVGASRILPLVTIHDPAGVSDLVDSLAESGMTSIEITLRTTRALEAIASASAHGRLTVGAGTVVNPDQVDQVADAGADFIVSPGFDEEVVESARRRGLAVLPGVATASEIQRAARIGLEAVKFFPAQQLGGVRAIAALSGPFPAMRFMPSGGVNASNLAEYLGEPSVFAVSGSWMVAFELIRSRDHAAIRALAREAVSLADGA